jgi:squalene-hopene/tetraprenyl-beta-curcumene cyclase
MLERIQPASGGFLEATPLTSFVVMSLAAAGRAEHAVAHRGVEFLVASARADGSWPIDTNLATWLTTQALDALEPSDLADAAPLRDWLVAQQHRDPHVYTDSPPGGWAWTDLSGGVPDADDTSGALLALLRLGVPRSDASIRAAARWLVGLQNRDGGWPTFCRGWGKLPFDRSAPDVTAHAIRALRLSAADDPAASRSVARAIDYLRRAQRADGSWLPLWFGNQLAPDKSNPVYGTSRVLLALTDPRDPSARRALDFLLATQNSDGGWGGAPGVASSVEETALAVRALVARPDDPAAVAAARRGGEFLSQRILAKGLAEPAPIGLYFSALWYSERLYPVIWSVGALGALLRLDAKEPGP